MHPLLSRLALLRTKVRTLETWRGICAVVALVVGSIVVLGILDFSVQLPSVFRAMALVGLTIGAALVAFQWLILPWVRPADDLTLALRIEEAYPHLNDALASTVQFLKQSNDPEAAATISSGTRFMRDRTIRQTLKRPRTATSA